MHLLDWNAISQIAFLRIYAMLTRLFVKEKRNASQLRILHQPNAIAIFSINPRLPKLILPRYKKRSVVVFIPPRCNPRVKSNDIISTNFAISIHKCLVCAKSHTCICYVKCHCAFRCFTSWIREPFDFSFHECEDSLTNRFDDLTTADRCKAGIEYRGTVYMK